MRDLTYHASTLQQELTSRDYVRVLKKEKITAEQVASVSKARAEALLENITFTSIKVNSKHVFQAQNLADDLVIRRMKRNVINHCKIKMKNRDQLIRVITQLLRDSTGFRVYKFDIKDFYESLRHEEILNALRADTQFPYLTTRLIGAFLKEISASGIAGLPRGISLSAALSEFVMARFDQSIALLENVQFYGRFVDDIIVFASTDVKPNDFVSLVERMLPVGLKFNSAKTHSVEFKGSQKGKPSLVSGKTSEGYFDYLGYRFLVSFAPVSGSRDVKLDIAPRKVARIKSRLCCALSRFARDGNFDDLHMRVKILTSNYVCFDQANECRRFSGIYQSYRLIDAIQSTAISDLDSFWSGVLKSKGSKLSKKFCSKLSQSQKNTLLCYSFRRSFEKRTCFAVSPQQLLRLKRCWSHA